MSPVTNAAVTLDAMSALMTRIATARRRRETRNPSLDIGVEDQTIENREKPIQVGLLMRRIS